MISPQRYQTILHAFVGSLEADPLATVFEIVEQSGQCEALSFEQLFRLAARATAAYDARGLRAGDRVVLALPTCRELFALYVAALFRRIVPLVEPLPRSAKQGGASGRLETVSRFLGARVVIVPDGVGGDTFTNVSSMFVDGEAELLPLAVTPADVAHLQSTSGSTGRQKVAIVEHGNIVANVSAIGARLDLQPHDKLAIWLPLYHDMGLIAVACTLYWQRPMVLTDPVKFVLHPIRYWLEMISRYGATITAAPNSAYAICARLARRRHFDGLDLSRLRAAFWGAEPLHPETIRAFEEAFAPYGYRPEATLPVYGLAEATLAVTMADVAEPPRIRMLASRRAEAVAVGRPIDGHRLRVVDIERNELPDGHPGAIEVAGPSVIRGYWEAEDAILPCAETDGFLRTGDLGVIDADGVFIVGRAKEIIIVGGANFIPSDIEAVVEAFLDNSLVKGVAAFGRPDPRSGTEQVHLLIESRVLPVPDQAAVEEAIRRELDERLGLAGAIVHWTIRGGIPRTTSGKIQRYRCREIVTADAQPATSSTFLP